MQRVGGASRFWTMLAVAYLVAQAVLTVAWWMLLRASPDARSAFELAPERDVLDAFLVADLAVFVVGSLVSALAIKRGWPGATAIVWFTAGGVVSATVLLIALVVGAGSAASGVAPMIAASLATVAVAALATPTAVPGARPTETAALPR